MLKGSDEIKHEGASGDPGAQYGLLIVSFFRVPGLSHRRFNFESEPFVSWKGPENLLGSRPSFPGGPEGEGRLQP